MRLDINKIDERIKRLEEVRRIASDPELVAVLTEFIISDQERGAPGIASSSDDTERNIKIESNGTSAAPEEVSELINEVVRGGQSQTGGGIWSRRRG